MNTRWIMIVILLWVALVVLDELAYKWWKTLYPGSKYTSVIDQTAGMVDPSNPPSTYQGA